MAIRRLLIVLPGLLAVLAVLASLAACTTVPATTGVPARTIRHEPRPAASASSAASATARADAPASSVTLAFAGDVHFTGRTARLLSDPATAFGPITTVLKSADFSALNFETAVTSRGTPQPKT
jgi:poly-gamma-glutamate synthesis protein (capsule biosynthesis protein)